MSSYTMRLGEYIEAFSQYETGLSLKEKIEIGRPKLFDFDYPIFDESYRKVFETNFIRNFYMREIGFETEGLFKMQLETWLDINMSYYNKLFESELIKFDPLTNTKTSTNYNKKNDRTQNDTRNIDQTSNTSGTTNGESNSNTTGNTNDDNFERKINADTPDDRLNLTTNDGQGILEYASSINEETENNKRTSSVDNTTTNKDTSNVDNVANQNESGNVIVNDIEDYIQEKTGKIGTQSYAKMIIEFRQSFMRLERDIFKEMNQLFMLIY